jgi:predicted neutral ceramidase superfamily lipid hydrolase
LNVSTKWLITLWTEAAGYIYTSYKEKQLLSLLSLIQRENEDVSSVKGALKLSFLVIATLSFAILYIMTSQWSLCLSSSMYQFKYCNTSPILDVFLMSLVVDLFELIYFTFITGVPGWTRSIFKKGPIALYRFVALRRTNWCLD